MRRLGIVTGLELEADFLAPIIRRSPAPIQLVHGGSDPIAAAQSLVENGVDSLMSLGIAGGLDPSLAPGQVVIATEIIDDLGMPYGCHESWRSELVEALKACSPIAAPLAGYDNVVATVSEKAAIHAVSNAVAVDTESHDVAYVAAQSDLPFAAIRVIADTAMRALPSAALAGDTGQGKIRYTAVFRELARHPLQIFDLVRLGLDTRKAMAALGRCAKVLFGGG